MGRLTLTVKAKGYKTLKLEVPADTLNEALEPLFEEEAARKFRSRWQVIQGKFVDDPRDSVKQADDLVVHYRPVLDGIGTRSKSELDPVGAMRMHSDLAAIGVRGLHERFVDRLGGIRQESARLSLSQPDLHKGHGGAL